MQPEARAALNGVSMATTQAEIAYAILEGIAHSVASCIDANRDIAGVPCRTRWAAGLSGSDALLQMQADLTGLPIHRMQETDRASLRGIAWLAGASGLLWDSLSRRAPPPSRMRCSCRASATTNGPNGVRSGTRAWLPNLTTCRHLPRTDRSGEASNMMGFPSRSATANAPP
jgi:glycerol kinase